MCCSNETAQGKVVLGGNFPIWRPIGVNDDECTATDSSLESTPRLNKMSVVVDCLRVKMTYQTHEINFVSTTCTLIRQDIIESSPFWRKLDSLKWGE